MGGFSSFPPRSAGLIALALQGPALGFFLPSGPAAAGTINELRAGEVKRNPKDGLEYAWNPAGQFMMGCTPGDGRCDDIERPRHRVVLPRGFWLGRTEVTVQAYQRFVAARGVAMPPGPSFDPAWRRSDSPIVNVTWQEATDYCEWSGGRLPSEAAWEYAARGGRDAGLYPWGNQAPECRHGVGHGARFHDDACPGDGPVPVASYAANPWGLFDLAGNADEWVRDCYVRHEDYAKAPADGSSRDDAACTRRAIRGGSWNHGPRNLRVSDRAWAWPDARVTFHGFRCARETIP